MRIWLEEPCEHGVVGYHPYNEADADGVAAGGCPGGQRRELTDVEVVDWCEEHRCGFDPEHVDPDVCWAWFGRPPCRIVPRAIIPLEEPE